MKIKIMVVDFELPARVKRVVLGVGIPLAVLAGAGAIAYAGVPHAFKKGDVLQAAELNSNFNAVDKRVTALEAATANTDCPVGYARDASVVAKVVCTKGADEIVKVGYGAAAFWVDRYEASVWSDAAGVGTQYGKGAPDYPGTFPENGQIVALPGDLVYAVSKKGVLPSVNMTWFQANLACLASGKRLPNGPEWLLAATGTSDPGISDGANGKCHTSGSGRRATGAANVDIACASLWGAQDMIGNVWEWTAEWYAAPTSAAADVSTVWPTAPYNGDAVWNVASTAYVLGAGWVSGMPAAAFRGGATGDDTHAGTFSLAMGNSPATISGSIGIRCVVPR